MRSGLRLVTVVVSLVALQTLVWAQTGTTSLRGTVTDKSGATVAQAKVRLTNPERGLERTTTSGPTGEFEFLQLQPTTYQLNVEMTGFRK
jgi:hypothetical protein